MRKRLILIGGFIGAAFTLIRTVISGIGEIETVQSLFKDRSAVVTATWAVVLHPLFGPAVVVLCVSVYL